MTTPPVVSLLLDENLAALSDPKRARTILKKGLFRELSRQGEWSFTHAEEAYTQNQPDGNEWSVVASGVLDPFSADGPCVERGCRVSRVPTFLRTIGLWADKIYVRDVFVSQLFAGANAGRFSVNQFSSYVRVLRALAPLVRADIIRFTNTDIAYCDDCKGRVPAEAAAELVDEFVDEFTFEVTDDGIVARPSGLLDDVAMSFAISADERRSAKALVQRGTGGRLSTAARKLRHRLISAFLSDQMKGAFIDMIAAQDFHSTLVSASRTDVLCVKAIERGLPRIPTIEAWERAREIRIPWLSELTAEEVLVVRERASTALPRFRERCATALVSHEPADSLEVVVRELREDAVEVEAELVALAPKIRARERNAIAMISTGVALYGMSALGVPAAVGIAQLLTTLGLIHGMAQADRTAESNLKSRPGYVLLKARELLAHPVSRRNAG